MALTAQVHRNNPEANNRLLYAIAISISLHVLFISILKLKPLPATQLQEQLIEVTLQPPIEKKKPTPVAQVPVIKNQMITPPDLEESPTPPKNTNLLSDKNTVTLKEQVKRGDGAERKSDPNPVKKEIPNALKKPTLDKATSEKADLTPQKVISPKEINLKLDPLAFEKLSKPPTEEQKESKNEPRNLNRYQPFTRNNSANAELFRFKPGNSDYLPNIHDGEVTMLNAKADKFAPFVRRVAGQVFGIVRKLQWHNIPTSDVMRIGEFTTIEAILSPKGELIRVQLQESSGSVAFDKVIKQSVAEGANDQNPPAGVLAADGNIHFIFKSRCWTRPGPPGIPDARWLLLATGLL